jgi:hypothetical protein
VVEVGQDSLVVRVVQSAVEQVGALVLLELMERQIPAAVAAVAVITSVAGQAALVL